MSVPDTADGPLRVNRAVTIGFTALTILTHATAATLDRAYAVVASVLFVIGIGLFALGFWNGVQRSRTELVTMSGLLAVNTGNVTASARRRVWSAVTAQIVVAVVAAIVRPFTAQAFGLLVPVFGIGIATLWGSRNAVFHLRDDA